MKRNTLIAPILGIFVVLGTLIPPGVPAQSEAVDATALQWWPLGKTGPGEGFHLRVPVTVQNTQNYPVDNGLVLAEIDIRQALIDAGWVHQARGTADILRSFELDEDSVRVVEMTNLNPSSPGSTNGLIKANDPSFPAEDARRYEVPSRFFTGFLKNPGSGAFDAKTNPVVTVMWRLRDVVPADGTRSYVVYFDSLTNGRHEPANPAALRGGGILERAFWSGPATDLLGLVAPESAQAGLVSVVGTQPDTQVTVLTALSGGLFAPRPSSATAPNPFTIGEGEIRDVFISNTKGTSFRLVADKPILALVDSEGFVPTPSGEIIGSEFFFSTTYPESDAQDSLFVYNRNPSGSTVMRLESLDDQTTKDIHLSDPVNQFPYSLGAHSSQPQPEGGRCVFPTRDEAVVLPTGRHHYRAHVISGGPVAMQLQPIRGITQIPSSGQTAYGTDFWTALSRSTAVLGGSGCLRNVQQYATYATSSTAARLELFSLDPSDRLGPDCTPSGCPPGLLIGPGPEVTMDGRTFTIDDSYDRPLNFRLSEPGWLMVAPSASASLASAPLRGPLGGTDGATRFAGLGPTDLYAPYQDTTVHATLEYSSSGITETKLSLAAERLTPLPLRGGGDQLLWYTLSSDRPILVLPRGAPPGFMAGIPPLLEATVHGADYRGYLIDLKSQSGLNPVTASTTPGVEASYAFDVTHLGRGAGASNLADTAELSLGPLPPGWTASVSRSSVRLDTGQSQEVVLSVVPPADAGPGDLGRVVLTATSRANPRVNASVDTVTHIKRDFDVGIWFDHVDGPKTQKATVAAGEEVEYAITVQNRGTVRDTVGLSVSEADTGWVVSLLRGGEPVDGVALDPFETASLMLRVVPPAGVGEGVLLTSVEARSLSSPAALDRVSATTKVRAPSQLALTTDNRTVWVQPGGEAVFNLTLRNDGLGTAEVVLDVQSDDLPGWTDPLLFLRQAGGGPRAALQRISIGPGDVIPIGIATTSPTDSIAYARLSMRFSAAPASDPSGVEDFLAVIVNANHSLSVVGPASVSFDEGAKNRSLELRIENQGNLDENLRVIPISVPGGWTLTPKAAQVTVARNGTQVLGIDVVAPVGVPEGSYDIVLGLIAADGNRTEYALRAEVGSFAAQAIGESARILAVPGQEARTRFRYENVGNVPVDVSVDAFSGEAWQVSQSDQAITVPPRATVLVPVSWRVPFDSPTGSSVHRASLHIQSSSPSVPSVERTIRADIDVGRPDLRVVEVKAFPGPSGAFVRALIANQGDRPGFDVDVALRVGDAFVDRVNFSQVAVGSLQNVSLLLPDGSEGAVLVVIDPDNKVPQADRAQLIASVHAPKEPGSKAPGLSAGLTVGILAAAALTAVRCGRRTSH